MEDNSKKDMSSLPDLFNPHIEPTEAQLRDFGREILKDVKRGSISLSGTISPMRPEEYDRRMEAAAIEARAAAKRVYGKSSGSNPANHSGA